MHRKRTNYLISCITSAGLMMLAANVHAVQWNGLLELEAGGAQTSGQGSQSDIALATVELGLSHTTRDNVAVAITVLHEDDDTEPAEIDSATMAFEKAGMNMVVGRQYLPFGRFETALVNDPLTLELAESRESAIGIARDIGRMNLGAYLFKGNIEKSTNAWAPDWMVNAEVKVSEQIAIQAYYLNNISDSDAMTDALAAGPDANFINAGSGAAVSAAFGAASLNMECISALSKYSNGDQPLACHAEAGYNIADKQLAVAWHTMQNDTLLGLPEQRISAGTSMPLKKDLALNLEWSYDQFAGNITANTAIAQIAYVF